MDPYRSSQRVRGGFSPLVTGNWTPPHLSGLGDLCDPTDLACQMSGQTNMNLITGQPVDVSGANTLTSLFGQIPMAAWLALGLGAVVLFAMKK
jgi:hypothetical protein